MLSKII